MRVEAYVQARYGRLLEHAIDLGVPDGQAADYVDAVLRANRRRIRRSADPDPMVRAELARAIAGRARHTPDWIAIALVLALVGAVGLSALLFRPVRTPLPSLLGYRGEQAEDRLRQAGLDVTLRPSRSCEPPGLVLGTAPPAGSLLRAGASVDVRVAVPAPDCPAVAAQRRTAWDVVAFARGLGAPPPLAPEVEVVVDGAVEQTLTRVEAQDPRAWGRAVRLVAEAAAATAPTDPGPGRPSADRLTVAWLGVDQLVAPTSWCGTDRPAAVAGRTALRLRLDADPAADGGADPDAEEGCSLTVDLYRDGPGVEAPGQVDTVVVYAPAGADR